MEGRPFLNEHVRMWTENCSPGTVKHPPIAGQPNGSFFVIAGEQCTLYAKELFQGGLEKPDEE